MYSVRSVFILLALIFIFIVPVEPKDKTIVVTNNHTNFLSVRCFSFDDYLEVAHLPSWGQYKFHVKKTFFYPSSTMFNCSTNMGTFVAFKFNYECSDDKFESCDWRFDEECAYRWEPKSNKWVQCDYNPNYESLNRGGVIRGYYSN